MAASRPHRDRGPTEGPSLQERLTMTPRTGTAEARLNPGEPKPGRDMSYLYPPRGSTPHKTPPYRPQRSTGRGGRPTAHKT